MVVQQVAAAVVVVVREVCEARNLDIVAGVGRDRLLKRRAGREVRPGKLRDMFALVDPYL